MTKDGSDLSALTVDGFLAEAAAGTAVPGGGSVAALAAALAAALVEMVANLTIGKKGYEAAEPEIREVAKTAQTLRKKLTADMDRDSAAYTAVIAAYRLPKAGEEEKTARSEAIQKALKTAAAVPLEVAQDAFRVLELAHKAVTKGNRNAASDGTVGAMMARTAVLSALSNVKINVIAITDREFADRLNQEAGSLKIRTISKEKEILSLVDLRGLSSQCREVTDGPREQNKSEDKSGKN